MPQNLNRIKYSKQWALCRQNGEVKLQLTFKLCIIVLIEQYNSASVTRYNDSQSTTSSTLSHKFNSEAIILLSLKHSKTILFIL